MGTTDLGGGASPTLSALIAAGTTAGHVAFGVDGARCPAPELVEHGSRRYAGAADAPAVGAVLTNDRPSVEVVLGAVASGATLVSLPPPARGADLLDYASFIRSACDAYEVAEVVVPDAIAPLAEGFGVGIRSHGQLDDRPLAAPGDAGFRLVQYSSGSTQDPKPVVLDDERLGVNMSSLIAALDPRPGDVAVSWLPLSHDMGLIGMLLSTLAGMAPDIAGPSDIVILDPTEFLKHPGVWLEALSRWKGTITAAPDFGYRLASERPPAVVGDLSPLRVAIVGGEVVRHDTLARFAAQFEGAGVVPEAMCPAYGMAEVGLAISLTPPDRCWQELSVSNAGIADELVRPPASEDDASILVASGLPMPGYRVACGTDEGAVGQIRVQAPSMGIDGRTGESFAGADGWYETGDAGFVHDDWVYVCGRTDDYFVAQGRNVYAPLVEQAVGAVDGVREGRVTAVGLPSGEWAIVLEPAARLEGGAADVTRIGNEARRAAARVSAVRPDQVIVVERGQLPLTTSGKLQRNRVRSRLLRGELVSLA